MNKYSKFIVALTGFVVMALTNYVGSAPPLWFNPLVALLTALSVYLKANE